MKNLIATDEDEEEFEINGAGCLFMLFKKAFRLIDRYACPPWPAIGGGGGGKGEKKRRYGGLGIKGSKLKVLGLRRRGGASRELIKI